MNRSEMVRLLIERADNGHSDDLHKIVDAYLAEKITATEAMEALAASPAVLNR